MDFYDVLGVRRHASSKDIRRAYLRAVKIHHPDQGGSPERFLEIRQAYAVLSDSTKRRLYDTRGTVVEEDDEAFQQHVEKEHLWASRLKQKREHSGPIQGDGGGLRHDGQGFVFYDIDAWEMGHGLGKYGNGPEGLQSLKRHYIEKAREEERRNRALNEPGLSSHQRFFRRRNEKIRKAEREAEKTRSFHSCTGTVLRQKQHQKLLQQCALSTKRLAQKLL